MIKTNDPRTSELYINHEERLRNYKRHLEEIKEDEIRLEHELEAAKNGARNKRIIKTLKDRIKAHKKSTFRYEIENGIMRAPVEFNSEDFQPQYSKVKMTVQELELYCAMHGYYFEIEVYPK